jgi:prepilin-type N-terminal cleavage/methylation domain-containing protein
MFQNDAGSAAAPPSIVLMRRGFTLAELIMVLAIVAIVMAVTLPRVADVRDWIAVNTAAQEVTTALAVAQNAAIMHSTRARAVIAADSLRIDRWRGDTWGDLLRWPGPGQRGVTLEMSNPEVVFDPIGLGWGLSNTKVVLRRGTRSETITVSRLGRVKRW